MDPTRSNPYTVIGLYPNTGSPSERYNGSFVHFVEATTPAAAAREAHRQIAGDEADPGEMAIIAVFDGHHHDRCAQPLDAERYEGAPSYRFISDPGHGWLRVPHADIVQSGIAHIISRFSYIDAEFVYLEEDVDAALFLEPAGPSGAQIIEQYQENTPIRGLPHYTPALLASFLEQAQPR